MMISRRQWLAGSAALWATLAACAPVARDRAVARRPIGLQLYTVRELFSRDPLATLEQVAAIGYREVEYGGGGYDRMDHAALRATMDRLELVSPSVHIGYEALASDFDGSVRMANCLTCTNSEQCTRIFKERPMSCLKYWLMASPSINFMMILG